MRLMGCIHACEAEYSEHIAAVPILACLSNGGGAGGADSRSEEIQKHYDEGIKDFTPHCPVARMAWISMGPAEKAIFVIFEAVLTDLLKKIDLG